MTRIWKDGEIIAIEEARPSILTHTLHYGVGVFEGIRSYASEDGSAGIFRLHDHLRRLFESAKVCGMEVPYSHAELVQGCIDVLQANDLRDGYLRPIAFHDDGNLGGLGSVPPVHVASAAAPWGAYLGDEGLSRGIRVMISSFRRGSHEAYLSKAKICGQYVVSTLAKRQALANGWDEALLTDTEGYVAEGTGENLFMVRHGSLVTPPMSASILPGITRDTILRLAHQQAAGLGLQQIEERNISRDELLVAEEVFLTGTAAEVTPIREIDGVVIGEGRAGPVTSGLQSSFFDLVKGVSTAPKGWRTVFGALVR